MILPMWSKKIQDTLVDIEPLLVFSAFFLPGYLTQSGTIDRGLFDSVQFNLVYIITALSETGIILYLILRRTTTDGEGAFSLFGLTPLHGTDLLWSLLALAGCFLILFCMAILITLLGKSDFATNNFWGFTITDWRLLPLIFITCMAIGYREELFFRSYLFTHITERGIPHGLSVLITSILFGLGHLYEGPYGFFVTTALGLYFGFVFVKRKNIHHVAIAHGLYNFFVLLISFWFSNLVP